MNMSGTQSVATTWKGFESAERVGMKSGVQRYWQTARLAVGLAFLAAAQVGYSESDLHVESVPVDNQSASQSAQEIQVDTRNGLWFPVGETLHYTVYWGVVPVAHSTASTEWIEEDGKRLLVVRFRTRSNKVLRKIYPVDDTLESVIDPETFLPVRFSKQLNEGRYHCDEVTVFDRSTLKATWTKNTNGEKREYAINPNTRDLISFMYVMRTQEPEVGNRQKYRVMADEKLYDLWVESEAKEIVNLERFGDVNSIRLEPEAAFEGLFVRKGKMKLWVSDDDRRIITRASVKVPVASVNIKLNKVTGPGDDVWVNPIDGKRVKKKSRRKRR